MEKTSGSLPTKETTKHTPKPHHQDGTVKGYKIKQTSPDTGKAVWVDGSRGVALDDSGQIVGEKGKSPVKAPKNKQAPLGQV